MSIVSAHRKNAGPDCHHYGRLAYNLVRAVMLCAALQGARTAFARGQITRLTSEDFLSSHPSLVAGPFLVGLFALAA